eukprot:COSAG02_NODE_230_length_28060_cov_5.226816_13_plen_313_part_00
MRRFSDLGALRDCCKANGGQFVVYNRWVLDVRGFSHPGPQQLVLSNVGEDVTKLFDERGHSSYARELCEQMAVGYIGEAESKPGQLLSHARETMTAKEEAIHKKLDSFIDITKPLVPQVKLLTNEEYLAFVRRPRYLQDTDGIKLHADEATESASRSDYGLNLRLVTPVVAVEVLVAAAWHWHDYGQGNRHSPALQFVVQFVLFFCMLGIGFIWTLTEYFFHAFVLHDEIRLDSQAPADGEKNANLFARHLHHHVFMNQKHRVVLKLKTYGKETIDPRSYQRHLGDFVACECRHIRAARLCIGHSIGQIERA